jgi:hypothetical protein
VLEVERHLLGIAVGEDQIVALVEPGEHVGAPAAKNTNPVGVPLAHDRLLGESRMFGITLDRLDDSVGATSQAERRLAEAASGLEKPFRCDCRRDHGQKRAAGRGINAAARSVRFPVLMRGEVNVLEWVALTLGGLESTPQHSPLRSAPLA